MTLANLDQKILQLMSQYSINGALTADTNNADYLLRTRNLIDACQKELASIRKLPEVYHLALNSIKNQINGFSGQQLIQHLDQDVTFNATGSKSYYFECDKAFTATIEVNGVVTNTITSTPTQFTAFKGLITSSSNSNVVIRFSGLYPYNIQNVALYAYTFASVSDIPQYRAYQKIDLPTDFKELRDIYLESYPFSYLPVTDYKFEKKTLLMNSFLTGNLAIHYYKYPATVDKDSLTTQELEIDIDIQELIPYYVAGFIYLEDNPTVATMLLNTYESKKAGIREILPDTPLIIENIYSGFL